MYRRQKDFDRVEIVFIRSLTLYVVMLESGVMIECRKQKGVELRAILIDEHENVPTSDSADQN